MTRRQRGFVLAGLFVALALAFGASRFASSAPDGLTKVAADHRLDSGGRRPASAAGPFAHYRTRGVADAGWSTGLAGAVGVGAAFAAAGGLVWVAGRFGPRRSAAEPA